jgi:hypothetical protein
MAETKYRKCIIAGAKSGLNLPLYMREAAEIAAGDHTRLIYLDDEVIEGSEQSIVGVHTHPFDEVIAFFETNREDSKDLCREVEL